MLLISLLVFGLNMCSAVDNVFEGTMFYSVPVKDVNLALVEVNEAKKIRIFFLKRPPKKKQEFNCPNLTLNIIRTPQS